MSGPSPSRVLVAGVRSRTHLVYAASWLRAQATRGHDAEHVGVLPTGDFLGQPRVSAADSTLLLGSATRGTVVTDAGLASVGSATGARVTLLCIGAPPVRLLLPAIAASRQIPRIVVVDEGLGSYGDTATRRAAYRRNGGSRAWSLVRAGTVSLGRRVLTSEEWLTYDQTHRGWSLNEDVADEFRHRVTGDSPPPRTAVLLTQPWPQLGVIDEPAYLAHLEKVRLACSTAGLHLTLRLHPADAAERYTGFRVATSTSPAEMDRGVIDAAVVMGASSTALLNIAAFYGTRCVRVQPPELAPLEAQLGPRQRSLLDAYLPAAVGPEQLTSAVHDL